MGEFNELLNKTYGHVNDLSPDVKLKTRIAAYSTFTLAAIGALTVLKKIRALKFLI